MSPDNWQRDADATILAAQAVAAEVLADESAPQRERSLAAAVLLMAEERRQSAKFSEIMKGLSEALEGIGPRLQSLAEEIEC